MSTPIEAVQRLSSDPDLQRLLAFTLEADRLKGVLRRSLVLEGARRENSAEHSWHLALMALLFADLAPAGVNPLRAAQMALAHDIVEIDAGDTLVYDTVGNRDKEERERTAADRLYSLLPETVGTRLRGLWEEFEAGSTADARYVRALDRLQPMLLNWMSQGASWRSHEITADRVRALNLPVFDAGAPALRAIAERLIDDAIRRGYLNDSPEC